MAWQGTRKTNEQATITEGPVRSEAPGESGRERGASCGQVCEQGRKPETLTAILRPSALIMWSTGEHGGCGLGAAYLHIRLQGKAAIEVRSSRHTDKEKPV